MNKKELALLLVPGVLVLALATNFRSAAQESVAPPARRLTATGKVAIYDESPGHFLSRSLLRTIRISNRMRRWETCD
jgi:hypothetical protein